MNNEVLSRAMKEALIYRHTHADYKGKTGGEKTILINRGATVLVSLNLMTDSEIEEKLPYALQKEKERTDKKAAANSQELLDLKPIQSDSYSVNAILNYTWGYEQTNQDFYCIVKRSGDSVTLVAMTSEIVEQGDMRGKSMPGKVCLDEKTFRRKIIKSEGNEICVRIKNYGSCGLWDGKPCSFTSYA